MAVMIMITIMTPLCETEDHASFISLLTLVITWFMKSLTVTLVYEVFNIHLANCWDFPQSRMYLGLILLVLNPDC